MDINTLDLIRQKFDEIEESKQNEIVFVLSFKAVELVKDRITCYQKIPYFEMSEDPSKTSRFIEFEPTYMFDNHIQVFMSFRLQPGNFTVITKKEYEELKSKNEI